MASTAVGTATFSSSIAAMAERIDAAEEAATDLGGLTCEVEMYIQIKSADGHGRGLQSRRQGRWPTGICPRGAVTYVKDGAQAVPGRPEAPVERSGRWPTGRDAAGGRRGHYAHEARRRHFRRPGMPS